MIYIDLIFYFRLGLFVSLLLFFLAFVVNVRGNRQATIIILSLAFIILFSLMGVPHLMDATIKDSEQTVKVERIVKYEDGIKIIDKDNKTYLVKTDGENINKGDEVAIKQLKYNEKIIYRISDIE